MAFALASSVVVLLYESEARYYPLAPPAEFRITSSQKCRIGSNRGGSGGVVTARRQDLRQSIPRAWKTNGSRLHNWTGRPQSGITAQSTKLGSKIQNVLVNGQRRSWEDEEQDRADVKRNMSFIMGALTLRYHSSFNMREGFRPSPCLHTSYMPFNWRALNTTRPKIPGVGSVLNMDTLPALSNPPQLRTRRRAFYPTIPINVG